MKAIGITCGIGSMLIGARRAGFEVVGNVEWRKYYHVKGDDGKNTFTENFPGAFFKKTLDDLTEDEIKAMMHADIAMGHPECGNFSTLQTSKRSAELLKDPGDIPLFVDLVARFKPRFFVMDDLPKAFGAFPMEEYAKRLPEYDLFPEWISNYGYGNIQKYRKRMFMIGALKTEKFTFRPGEFDHNETIRQRIEGVEGLPNHVLMADDRIIRGWSAHHFGIQREDNKVTLGEIKEQFKDFPVGQNFPYINRFGESKIRPGYRRIRLDGPAPVMTGGGAALDNHYKEDTMDPFTIRERARIQGCPDDFIFYPLNYLDDWAMYDAIYKQTGKFMPVEFCTYIAEQIAAHIRGERFCSTGERMLKGQPNIDEAKKWYCENVGYTDQPSACEFCHQTKDCEGPQPSFEELKEATNDEA